MPRFWAKSVAFATKGEPLSAEKEIVSLLLQIRKGEEQAFTALSEQFEPLVESAVKRFCKPPVFAESDGEDLRQEAMLALFKAAMSFDEAQTEVSFGLYAKICINNRLISAKRTRLRKMQSSAEYAGAPRRGVGRPRKAREENKQRGAGRLPTGTQLQMLMQMASEDLSDLEKEVFGLYLSGMRYKDIAQSCALDVKSVDNALLRAKRKIKKRAGRA